MKEGGGRLGEGTPARTESAAPQDRSKKASGGCGGGKGIMRLGERRREEKKKGSAVIKGARERGVEEDAGPRTGRFRLQGKPPG